MIIKICPLCDSEMKRSHYCDTCNSFIWKPEKLDVHYNVGSRGMGEFDCSYGDDHDAHDHGRKNRDSRKTTSANVRRTQTSAQRDHDEVFGEKKKKKRRGCLPFIIAFIIFELVLSFLPLIEDLFEGDLDYMLDRLYYKIQYELYKLEEEYGELDEIVIPVCAEASDDVEDEVIMCLNPCEQQEVEGYAEAELI